VETDQAQGAGGPGSPQGRILGTLD
jgi:hypothetical protein